MTTEISDDALRTEVRAWLKANYRPEELRGATLWSSTPETRAWLTKVLEAGWATPRWRMSCSRPARPRASSSSSPTEVPHE